MKYLKISFNAFTALAMLGACASHNSGQVVGFVDSGEGDRHPAAGAKGPEPSKLPCDSEKNCDQTVKLDDGSVVGAIVNRSINDKGVVQEYVKDTTVYKDKDGHVLPPLTWSPEASNKMNHIDAAGYCAAKTDLGLKWTLPSREHFRVAFNPSNPDYYYLAYNKALLEALDTKNTFLWSSSVLGFGSGSAWGFNGYIGALKFDSRGLRGSVRCVGR